MAGEFRDISHINLNVILQNHRTRAAVLFPSLTWDSRPGGGQDLARGAGAVHWWESLYFRHLLSHKRHQISEIKGEGRAFRYP
jgi:hypothetical protein